jgi:hypothetical protein
MITLVENSAFIVALKCPEVRRCAHLFLSITTHVLNRPNLKYGPVVLDRPLVIRTRYAERRG